MFENKFLKITFVLLIISVTIIPLIYLPYNIEKGMLFQEEDGVYRLLRHDNIYRPKIDLLLVLVVIMLFTYLLALRKKEISWKSYTPYYPLLFFALFLVISSIFSDYSHIVLQGRPFRWEGLLAYTVYMSILLLASQIINSKSKLLWSLRSLFISGVIISIYGFIQYLGYDFINRDPLRAGWSGRIFSTLGNPNFAGSYIILLLIPALILYIGARKKKNNYLYGILTTIFYSFMIMTYTRTAWTAFIFIIFLGAWLMRKRIKEDIFKIAVLAVVLIIITGVIDWHGNMYFRNRLFSLYQDSSTLMRGTEEEYLKTGSNRTFIFLHTLPLLGEDPLWGSGLDTFAEVFPQEKYQEHNNTRKVVDKAHNEYLQLGVTAGLPALLSYLLFLFLIMKKGISNLYKKDPLQLGLFLALVAYLIQAFGNISVVSVAPVFWFILGLNIVYNFKIISEQPAAESSGEMG